MSETDDRTHEAQDEDRPDERETTANDTPAPLLRVIRTMVAAANRPEAKRDGGR